MELRGADATGALAAVHVDEIAKCLPRSATRAFPGAPSPAPSSNARTHHTGATRSRWSPRNSSTLLAGGDGDYDGVSAVPVERFRDGPV